jgi:high affinity sulfate transporter 1
MSKPPLRVAAALAGEDSGDGSGGGSGGGPGFRKSWLRLDLVAGLVGAAVVLPKAMAYATVAGLPVQVGIATAMVPMAVYALLGTSRPLSVSTTTTIAILTASQLAAVAPDGDPGRLAAAAATLTVLVGAALLLAGLFRLGFIADFISEPVLIGFKAGIALVIVLDQLPKLLGVAHPHTGFFRDLLAILASVPGASIPTVVLGIAALVLLVVLERRVPRVPAPLVVVAAGISAAALLDLPTRGVALVGEIPRGLLPLRLPDLELAGQLWAGALGIALMSFTETIAAGRAFALREEPPIRANRELFATGLANAAGALTGTMPAGGGTSQTAVNRLAGARSQLAALVTATVALLTLLFLAPVLGKLPQAVLAAVVIVYSVGLYRPEEFRAVRAIRRTEYFWALTALAGVVLLGTLRGILVAVVTSLVALAHQSADVPVHVLLRKRGTNVYRPRSPEHPDDESFPGLLMLRLEGSVFFANTARLGEKLQGLIAEAEPRVVALDLGGVPDLEYTALRRLIEAERRLREQGVELWLVGLNPEVLSVVRRSALAATLGHERMQFTMELAVASYLERCAEAAPGGAATQA